jgi:hypothetical protein
MENPEAAEYSDEDHEVEIEVGESIQTVFTPYIPFPAFRHLAHPEIVEETKALACVNVQIPSYQHSIPSKWLDETPSRLSGVQMDAIVLAGASHERFINGYRQGFILGDGTGVGKGREIVGMIADNWYKGRQKSIWVSCNRKMVDDAKRDRDDVVQHDVSIKLHSPGKSMVSKNKGIMFITYRSLSEQKKKGTFKTVENLVDWAGGRDFDGLVIL